MRAFTDDPPETYLLFEMQKLDAAAVCSECVRKNAAGLPLIFTTWATAEETVYAAALAKTPSECTRSDAIAIATNTAVVDVALSAVGWTAVLSAAGVDEMEYIGAMLTNMPRIFNNQTPDDPSWPVPLALLCLELVRSEADEQPEVVIAGAYRAMSLMTLGNSQVATALFEAGFVAVAQDSIQGFNPLERVSRRHLIPTTTLDCLKNVAGNIIGHARIIYVGKSQPCMVYDSGLLEKCGRCCL